MGKNIKEFRVNCINRIKYEKVDEFETSLFADVYSRAVELTASIVDANMAEENQISVETEFCTEERFNNIISFWGERGMGKSSAMLSFALFLKKYEPNGCAYQFKFREGEKLKFHVLPRIDAAMLVKGENLLDIILAKMWSTFDEKEKRSVNTEQDSQFIETKKRFGDVKKSYEAYQNTILGKKRKDMTSVRQLSELSKCLNLREDFKKLVVSYLEWMENNVSENKFLVLTIDDLDVVVDDVNNILEQIRLFLMIPKVIVLVTADFERLYLDCNRAFSSKLICKDNIQDNEKKQVRSYTEKYLSKIFPSNMRVYMPRINVMGGIEYKVKLPRAEKILRMADGQEYDEDDLNEKKILFTMLAKYTNIMMYPFDDHIHILQKNSLRTIANALYELSNMHDIEEQQRSKVACRWIQNALIDYARAITDEEEYNCIQGILNEDRKGINIAIEEVLFYLYDKAEKADEYQVTYGELLKLLSLLRKNGHRKFVQFILVLYSTYIAEMFGEISEKEEFAAENMKHIFSPFIEGKTFLDKDSDGPIEVDKIPVSALQMEFIEAPGQYSAIECIEKNIGLIHKVFKIAMLCEWDLWKKSKEDEEYIKYVAEKVVTFEAKEFPGNLEESQGISEEKGETSKICLLLKEELQIDYAKSTVGNTLQNYLSYEEKLKGFIYNIYIALCELLKEKEDKNVEAKIKKIVMLPIFEIKKYRKWNQGLQKGTVTILPLQSAEVMCYMAEKVSKIEPIASLGILERILQRQEKQVEKIIAELEKVENYYSIDLGTNANYSKQIKTLRDIVDPYAIESNIVKRQESTRLLMPRIDSGTSV
ncbi:MAG: hypothetical protein IJ405_03355 [Lachnospiraceae bacterium]|nr:hypothetical protein [Lachnospiraceae bacterium]